MQRPLRGSRISTFYPVKNLPSLASLDSAFQLQEYISLLIRLDVHDVAAIVSLPGKGTEKDREKPNESSGDDEKDAEKERKSDIAVDEACWIYEQLRCAQNHSISICFEYDLFGQTAGARPISPFDHHTPARMHTPFMPRNESWRMVVLMCCSWRRWGEGGTYDVVSIFPAPVKLHCSNVVLSIISFIPLIARPLS
jgi:hypothetical protein